MRCPHCGKENVEQARFCVACGESLEERPAVMRMHPPVPGAEPSVPSVQQPAANAQQPALATKATRGRRPRKGRTTFALSLLAQGLVVVFEVFGVLVCMPLHLNEEYGATMGGALGVVVATALLGGISLFVFRREALAESFRQGWWFLVVNGGLLVFSVAELLLDSSMVVADGWPLRVTGLLVLCLAIGVMEEGMFRGLLLHGMLAAFGRTWRSVHVVIIVSSVLFGLAHIDFAAVSLADPMSVAQALLKTVQTGLLGYLLSVLTLRTKSLVGCAALHGLGDFMLLVVAMGLCGDSLDVSYVASGSEAVETAILYVVIIALYVPLAIRGYRLLRTIDPPQYGAFYRE